MVTSTSTPASMLMIICLTTSVGAVRSISRLWMRISYESHVLEPSPQGVFRVVTFSRLVGSRTGPLTVRDLPWARSMSSRQTFSSAWTLREVRVMRILCCFYFRCPRQPSSLTNRAAREEREHTGASPKSLSGFW